MEALRIHIPLDRAYRFPDKLDFISEYIPSS